MASDNFDTRYFQTDGQETIAAELETGKAVMGVVCLNREEFFLVVEMIEAIAVAGCNRIEFIEVDEDGNEMIVEPGLNDVELAMLNLITDTYAPLIAAARSKGRSHGKQRN